MRLDAYLVANGLARSRERAKELIKDGRVLVNGSVSTKASAVLDPQDRVAIVPGEAEYVSRGAQKLLGALSHFSFDPSGKTCLDLGASTGGFTQVLLEHGARRVYAVDVGTDQLAGVIAADPRVVNLDQTHAKDLTAALITERVDLLVCDVSFISLFKVLPFISPFLHQASQAALLVKPQFELGREHLGKRGIVRMELVELQEWMARDIVPQLMSSGWDVRDVIVSPIKGGDGNTEFLVAAQWKGDA